MRSAEKQPSARPDSIRDQPVDLGSPRLLGFYDRLRVRVADAGRRRGGAGGRLTELLLFAPDLFLLLLRLTLDRRVPAGARQIFGGALAYFLLPADLLPEVVLGIGGFVDDVILAAAVVGQVSDPRIEGLVVEHWSGSDDLRHVLENVGLAARAMVGGGIYKRLVRVLSGWGIRVRE